MRALAALVLLLPAAAAAQPTVAELRARADASEAAHPELPPGTFTGIRYFTDVAERIGRTFAERSIEWRGRAERYLDETDAGRDPFATIARGAITMRGYDSPISTVRQGYGIYLPADYDPSRTYPLLVMLHGGSSNGNLFLGVVLGNNMDWETYDEHLWDEYAPRWSPDWIVVAPDGFGQVLWRWMGEEDVLRVVEDVQAHYSVDPDRIVLGGLSNGGLGAYAIGARHAWRFSLVHAIAGAPSWVLYTGGNPTDEERLTLYAHSAMHLAENTTNTTFRFFHGSRDPGPMRPAYVTRMEEEMEARGLTPNVQWFDHGHDLLYLVHRHGRVYPTMAAVVRDRRPSEVQVVTGDYRAARQHWLEITRFDGYPALSRNRAIASAGAITVSTGRGLELALHLDDAPIGDGDPLRIEIDGSVAYEGPRRPLGHVAHFVRGGDGAWAPGFLPTAAGLEKIPGLSGPLTDPYRDGMIHVYGTQDPEATDALREAAERGARGWPLWLWNHVQPVVADSDVTEEMMRRSHLVLYGTPGANAVLERMAPSLPISVTAEGVRVGETLYGSRGVGTRFVYPNPLVSDGRSGRYVIVQAAPTLDGVRRGHDLPDFLPDWVVYDASTTGSRSRLISGRGEQIGMGYFDRFWQLAPTPTVLGAVPGELVPGSPGLDALRALPARPETWHHACADVMGADDGPVAALDVVLAQHDAGVDAPDAYVETPEERERRLALNLALGMPEDFVMSPSVLEQNPPPELPPGEALPVPPPPRRFGAPRSDPAGRIARIIARRIPTFPNYRAIIPGGEWDDDAEVWQIRSDADCLAALDAAAIPYVRPTEELTTPIPTPVTITGPIGGVEYAMLDTEEVLTVSCEMALRMQTISRVLAAHDVVRVQVLSAYRNHPRSSFHTMGLGLDLFDFTQADGTVLSVLDDFVETPAYATCDAPRGRGAARTLLRIACELAESHAFSSVLTPNYNDGHRNHFHLDARPDDPRTFVR
jgi:hypothetical protein